MNLTQSKNTTVLPLLIALTLGCLALSPTARADDPKPTPKGGQGAGKQHSIRTEAKYQRGVARRQKEQQKAEERRKAQKPNATKEGDIESRTSKGVVAGVPASGLTPRHTRDIPRHKLMPVPAGSGTVTVTGTVVYNDLRENGHFDWRLDRYGQKGSQATGKENYLGAWNVVADFYELDSVGGSPLHLNCNSEKYLGSTTLNNSGEYSFSFSAVDDCGADDDTVPDIGVRFRLRFCNNDLVCFSIEDDSKDVYQLWHPNACPDTPLNGSSGTHALSMMAFQTSSDGDDDYAKAACNFAYMVDAMWVWHIINPVPFDPRGDGEVYVQFPSEEAVDHGTAYTGSDHRIFLKPTWNYESTVWHEYGHVLHTRAWNGSTGDCGDCPGDDYSRGGDDGWDATELEYPHMAFKEGWAEFAKSAVRYSPLASSTSFDNNESIDKDDWICSSDPNQYPQAGNRVTYPNDGKSYIRNVKKLLCDWYDDGTFNDDDANMAGNGDHFTANLYSVWYNLDQMWDWAQDRDGLTICDYIDYYLNGRKSGANAGSSKHDDYVSWISNLAFNNGIECDLTVSTEGSSPGTSSGDEAEDAEDKIQDKLDKLKEHYDEYGPH